MKIYYYFFLIYNSMYSSDVIDKKMKLQSYFNLLYPSIKDINITMDTVNVVQNKTDDIFIYGIFDYTYLNKNILLLNYLNINVMTKKILQLLDHKKLTCLSIFTKLLIYEKEEKIIFHNIKIQGLDNIFFTDVLKYTKINNNLYNELSHKIINIHVKEEEPYEVKLTPQEKKIYIDIIQNNIQVKYLLFLLDHFDDIYNEIFVIFSPFNSTTMTKEEAKTLLTKEITLYLYQTIFDILY